MSPGHRPVLAAPNNGPRIALQLTGKDSLADTVKARWPKDTLVARLRASLRYCATVLEGLGPLDSQARAHAARVRDRPR